MKHLLFASVLCVATGCFDFEAAYRTYCDGGRCATGGGTSSDSGASTGGGSATGGGAATGGGTMGDGGASDGGFDGGADAGVDAGCLGYGATCSTEGQCCETADAGLPMACSRNNYCQDTAVDCRNEAFTCARDEQCCSRHCTSGRCAACGEVGAACNVATDCCVGYACVSGACQYGGAPNGARCQASDSCTSAWCDATDAGVNDGVCAAATSCAPLGASHATLACCPGLTPGPNCCMPDNTWCTYASQCCSGECAGGRCGTQATTGSRCTSQCPGRNYCDPVSGICNNRWCLPGALNAYSGCCDWPNQFARCSFADGGACILPGNESTDGAACCSGSLAREIPGFARVCSGPLFF